MKKLPISNHRILDRLVSYGMKAPDGAESLPTHTLIKVLRHSLGMTQAQLAKRAGLFQYHIAKIEKGQLDLRLNTLQKIFQALGCSMLVLPKFAKKPEAIVAEHAKETAKKKIARLTGTMALENQLPDKSMTRDLIRMEEERLKAQPSSEVWGE